MATINYQVSESKETIKFNSQINDSQLLISLKKFPKLKMIDLSFCNEITEKGLEALKNCTQLKRIDLSWCNQFNDNSIRILTQLPIQLDEIKLSFWRNLEDGSMTYFHSWQSLKVVYLKGMKANPNNTITDIGIATLAQNCRYLQKVVLAWCIQITDSGVKILSQNCEDLQEIDLYGCNKLTYSGVMFVAEKCQKLKEMILPLSINDSALDIFKRTFPNIKVI